MPFRPDLHHRRSIRLQEFDYSQDGFYFVTICTQGREHFFGEVVCGEMRLNEMGEIADSFFRNIESLHDFVVLDVFVVMPNHVHGIIVIDRDNRDDVSPNECDPVGARQCDGVSTNECDAVGARQWRAPTITPPSKTIHDIQLPKKGIPSLVNHYKGATKKWANKNHHENFLWQRNYHEHIIRDDAELERIRAYILDNPKNWQADRFFC